MRKIKLLLATMLSLFAWTGIMAQSGTQNDPFVVKSAADLNNLHNLLVSGSMNYVVMENDVDMAEVTDWTPLFNIPDQSNGYPFIDFDGKGHVIKNLTSKTEGAYDYCGLFGVLCGNVRNLGVENADVTCAGGTGILAGYLGHSTYGQPCYVENVWVTGKLSASGYCGGMFGNVANECHIYNCYANVEVTGGSDLTGGIIGRVRALVDMVQVYAAGSINRGGGIIGGGHQDATPLGTYKHVVVWNNTTKNFGPVRENEDLRMILYYDGTNFAELQSQVVAWEPEVWYCDMKEGSYPVLVSFLDSETKLNVQYEATLAAITNGGVYYVKANGFYLKTDGTLTASKEEASEYIFQKVPGSFKKYGFLLNCNGSFFSNPPGTSEANLKSGKINTSTRGDYEYEAQVFFLKDGKYAVRAGNTPAATSGWAWVAGSYWTSIAEADAAIAQYQWEPDYIWELEIDEDKTAQSLAYNTVQNWPYKIQTASGLVKDAAAQYYSNAKESSEGSYEALLDGEYSTYFHSCWSNGPAEDHYLQAKLDEPVQKFQFYYKKRHSNNNNRPTSIVISASNDGTSFTDIKTIEEGLPVDASVLDYVSDVIDLGAEYKYVRYTIKNTNNGVKCNEHYFFTFSEFYMIPENQAFKDALTFYKTGISRFSLTSEDVANINKIDEDLNNVFVEVTYQVKFGEEIVATETAKILPNSKPTLPETLKSVFVTFSDPDIPVITQTDNVVTYTATWDGPFQLSTSIADAKWYNMTIRSDYSVFVDASEPYYPKKAEDYQKASDAYQWAFSGNPYTGIMVFNKAKGEGYTLTKSGDAAVMREGQYVWTIGKNSDGFTLKEVGTAYNSINQSGGTTGPLKFWNHSYSPTDNGSTFRISAVPTSFEWTVSEAGYATMYVPCNVNVVGDTSFPTAVGAWTFDDPQNPLAGKGVATMAASDGVTFADGVATVPVGDKLTMTTNLGVSELKTYTFMMDVMVPADKGSDASLDSYTALFQNKPNNDDDGSFFIKYDKNTGNRMIGVNAGGLGYGGSIDLGTKYRVIFVSENSTATVYVNGVKTGAAASAIEKHWTLKDVVLFFADNDGEENEVKASEIRFWDVALTADQAAALGAAGSAVPKPNDVMAYTGVVCGESLSLNEIEGTIPAGTPVVLKAAPGTYTFAVDNKILNVAKACELTNALADKATSEEIYSVVGYVTNLFGKPTAKNQQSFYIADTPEGGKDFEAYLTSLPEGVETFVVGQKVKITGKLYKYVSSKGVVTLEISNPDVVIYDNDLKGTYEEIDAAGKYVLAKPEGKNVGLYKAESGKIAAGKAFLELPEGTPEIKAFYFNGDAETAIETIAVENNTKVSDGIFNLSGQRVNKALKGIYIINGKKVLR